MMLRQKSPTLKEFADMKASRRAQRKLVNRSLESNSEYVLQNHRRKRYLVTSLDHLQRN